MNVTFPVKDEKTGKPVPGVNIDYYVERTGLCFKGESDGNGDGHTDVPAGVAPFPHTAQIGISHPGYTMAKIYLTDVKDVDREVPLTLVPFKRGGSVVSPVAWPIHRDGLVLKQADGQIFRGLGVTATILYKLWLDGNLEQLNAYAKYVVATLPGVTMFRVFGMLHNITRFYPQDYGDRYYSEFPKFCAYFKETWNRGIYLALFADAQYVMPDGDARVNHAVRMKAVCKDIPNLFGEGCNEPMQNIHGGDAEAYRMSMYMSGDTPLWTSGASSEEAIAAHHYGPDFVDIHPPRDAEWYRKLKDVLDLRDQTKLPCWAGEPIGINEQEKPGSRTNNPQDCATAGANAQLHGLGSFIHGDDMHKCVPFGPTTERCAQAWHDAAVWVPVEAQLARFTRGTAAAPCAWTYAPGDAPSPAEHRDDVDLRSYAKTGDFGTYLVQCHVPGQAYRPAIVPCAGWAVEALGPSAGLARMRPV